MEFEFLRDKYKTARGTHSRLLNLHCRKCKNKLAIYQKDGPGELRRLYLDRIFYPKNLTNLETKPLSKIATLKCSKCNEDIGTPYIYKKEKRKAFKVYQDAIIKKIRKLKD
jgi:ribosomal protein S27E